MDQSRFFPIANKNLMDWDFLFNSLAKNGGINFMQTIAVSFS